MYALDSAKFNTGMLAQYLSTQLGQIGKASSLALLLLAKTNWKADNSFGPRGTVNHLTVRKMADALDCSTSTVHEHLAVLKQAGIISSEHVRDENGAIAYCRVWFSGFVAWLKDQIETSSPPSNPHNEGVSENSERNLKNNNQNIIDLDDLKTVKFTELEQLIKNAGPQLASGQRADSQLVYDKFRSYNLRKGVSRIGVAALIGFAKKFKEISAFKPKSCVLPSQGKAPESTGKPVTAADVTPPADPIKLSLLRQVGPEKFNAWFKNLDFKRVDGGVQIQAPTKFISTYVSEKLLCHVENAVGEGLRIEFV